MNKMHWLLLTASLALASVTGCAYRSPEMWRDDVGKVLQSKQGDMQACYDGVLKSNPGAAGTVVVAFDVETEQGAITNVTVDKARSTAPEPVQECVTKNMGGLNVAPPDGRLGQGSWAFDFAPTKT